MTFLFPRISTSSLRYGLACAGGCLAVLGVVGCASGPKKLAVCNGRHLRDVNIYGSVLPGSPVPATTAPRAAPPIPPLSRPRDGDPPPPPAVPSPSTSGDKVSVAPREPHYASC
jgi:hypothetical protein